MAAEFIMKQGDTHDTPTAGYMKLYPKVDGFWYQKEDDGTETKVAVATGTTFLKTVFVGKHGNDASDGTNHENAVLTFGQAITLVNADVPATNNRWAIFCSDSGQYTENLTIPTYTSVIAISATLIGNHTITDNSTLHVTELQASSGVAITKSTGAGHAEIHTCRTVLSGSASGVGCTSGVLIASLDHVLVENGSGIGAATSASLVASFTHIDVTGTGNAIACLAAGDVDCHGGSIEDTGSGTGVAITTGGECCVTVAEISCNTAYNVAAGCELNLLVAKLSGTETNSGVANVTDAGAADRFAEMYWDDNAVETTINTVDVWEEVDNAVTGMLSGWTFANSDLTAGTGVAGTYLVAGSVSSAAATLNKTFELAVSINNNIQTKTISRRRYSSSDVGSQSLSGILTIADGDIVKLEVRNITDNVNITVQTGNLYLHKIS